MVTLSMTNSEDVPVRLIIDDDVIDGNDSDSVVIKVVEPLWWSVSIHNGLEAYEADLAKFTEPQRHAFAIEWYCAEVANGGHHQFYSNSTGIVWPDAIEGFDAIGMKEAELNLRSSTMLFRREPSRDHVTRVKQLEPIEVDAFVEFDDRFVWGSERQPLHSYIRENRSSFYFDGVVQIPYSIARPRGLAPKL